MPLGFSILAITLSEIPSIESDNACALRIWLLSLRVYLLVSQIKKNIDQPVVRVTGYNSIPAALDFCECLLCAKNGHSYTYKEARS